MEDDSTPPAGEWTPRRIVLVSGVFTFEEDAEGRWFVNVPDGKRETGLSWDELASLAGAIERIARERAGNSRTDSETEARQPEVESP